MDQGARDVRGHQRRLAGVGLRTITPRQHAADPSPRWSSFIEWGAALIPPVTVLTALTVWFGYELVRAQATYFGVDPSLLGYTTSDYVLRSVTVLFTPLLVLLLCAIALVWLHVAVQSALSSAKWTVALRALAWVTLAIGAALTAEGIRASRNADVLAMDRVLQPWVLAAGVVMVTYAMWLLGRTTGSAASVGRGVWNKVNYVLVTFVILFSMFSSITEFAHQRGRDRAESSYKEHLAAFTRVVVYSARALAIAGPGVEVSRVTDPGGAYQWRYSGLRLLVRSAGRYFILPSGWSPTEGMAIILRDSADLRFEFQPPGESTALVDQSQVETAKPDTARPRGR